MRGNRLFFLIVGAAIALSACGGSEVTVQVLGEGADGPVPQANLEVFFYPFDRDSVFDVLDTAKPPRRSRRFRQDMLATFARDSLPPGGVARARSRSGPRRATGCRRCPRKCRRWTLGPGAHASTCPSTRNSSSWRAWKVDSTVRSRRCSGSSRPCRTPSPPASGLEFKAVRDIRGKTRPYAGYFDMPSSRSMTELGRQVYADTTSARRLRHTLPPGSGDWWVNSRIRIPVGDFVWNLLIDPAQVDTLWLDSRQWRGARAPLTPVLHRRAWVRVIGRARPASRRTCRRESEPGLCRSSCL